MKQTTFKKDIVNPPQSRPHGGKRRGAGRKRRVDEGAHAARPVIDGSRYPLHITVRLQDGLPGLRRSKTLKHLQNFMKEAQKFGLRVNHFALLSNHIHLIAEVDDSEALKSGMMSFNGRLGRWLRKQVAEQHTSSRKASSRGLKVSPEQLAKEQWQRKFPRGFFKGRYHVQVIKSVRQMKNVLRYVLLNASKHFRKCPYIDQFSSAASFQKWPELLREKFYGLIQAQVMSLQEDIEIMGEGDRDEDARNKETKDKKTKELMDGLIPPSTWLGRVGWQRG